MTKNVFAFLVAICSQVSFAEVASLEKTMHDPTMPVDYNLPETKAKKVDFELIMTFISDRGRIAIINGSTYEEGSVVDNFRVLKIDYNKVSLKSISTGKTIIIIPKQNKKSSLISGAN